MVVFYMPYVPMAVSHMAASACSSPTALIDNLHLQRRPHVLAQSRRLRYVEGEWWTRALQDTQAQAVQRPHSGIG